MNEPAEPRTRQRGARGVGRTPGALRWARL